MDIVVKKTELLEILEENKAKHRTVFNAAIEGFRVEAERRLKSLIRDLADGKTIGINLSLPLPQDHTRDYERVIRMVGLHQGDQIPLEEREVAMYVMDDWAWRREFVRTSSTYAAQSVHDNYGPDDF